MDRQKIFEGTVRGLAAQGWVKAMDGEECIYGEPGAAARCAIGVHLGDKRMLTRSGVTTLFSNALLSEPQEAELQDRQTLTDLFGVENSLDAEFLAALQRAHDFSRRSQGPDGLKRAFKVFAVTYGLDFPEGI